MERITDVNAMADVMVNGVYQDHHQYEEMASHVSGAPAPTSSWRGERLNADFGQYLSITLYRPLGDKPPVIAFGNTRLSPRQLLHPAAILELEQRLRELIDDLREDVFPGGIGYYRYCYNEAHIKQLFERLVARYGQKVIVTGHSLGGVLAQLAGVRLPEYVASVVTFQAPKTTREAIRYLYDSQPIDVSDELQRSSYHYNVGGGDLIQQAGEFKSPGEILSLTFFPREIGLPADYRAHVKQIFEGFGSTRGSVRAIRALAARKLASIGRETTGNPSGEVQGRLSAVIEWLRSNAALLAAAISGAVGGTPIVLIGEALPILQRMIYTMVWTQNVLAFRAAPDRYFRFDFFPVPVPGLGDVSTDRVFTSAEAHRMRRAFANYIRHSRVRRR